MSSYLVDEFVGDGVLKGIIPKLVEGGWNDVPTLKMMKSEDMDAIKLTQDQKDALKLRSYLHDRSLMEYANALEASRRSLSELLMLNRPALFSQFGMKRGHITRFINRSCACSATTQPSFDFSARRRSTSSLSRSSLQNDRFQSSKKKQNVNSSSIASSKYGILDQSIADFKVDENYVFKGIVASEPDEPRLCCFQPPPVVDGVAPYSTIENISVQKLTPEYKVGMEVLVATKAPPMKASNLWHDKPVVLLCIRRPGCIMCRAEAHQLYARKPFFDALGFQMIAVLHEHIESEVKEFWPRYWGGVVILDRNKEFFKALGGGKLLKGTFITGFLLNPRAISNYKRAKETELKHNYKGEGEIKGGLFIIGQGRSSIAYQFIERNFGDWAPITEVIEICNRMQRTRSGKGDSEGAESGSDKFPSIIL